MNGVLLLALLAAADATEYTSSIIRFVDADGRARLLAGAHADGAVPLRARAPWAVSATEVAIATLLAPIARPPALYAIGLNYWGHINATNSTPPKTPSLFFKNAYAFNDPLADVVVPAVSTQPDYEGELGVVLGPDDCKDVAADEGCPGNGGQFSFSKGFDTHAPVGPALVAAGPGDDGGGLRLTTRVNGELRQNVSTP